MKMSNLDEVLRVKQDLELARRRMEMLKNSPLLAVASVISSSQGVRHEEGVRFDTSVEGGHGYEIRVHAIALAEEACVGLERRLGELGVDAKA